MNKYYVFTSNGDSRKIKAYKTLTAAKRAARYACDQRVYVANGYNNLRPVEES